MTPQQILSSRTEADRLYRIEAFAEAATIYRKLIDSNPDDSDLRLRLANCCTRLGQTEQAIVLAQEALQLGCKFPAFVCYEVAKSYAKLDNKEACFDWLEKSLEARWENRPGLIEEELFQPYRNDQRFIKLAGLLPDGVERNRGWQLDLKYLVEEAQRLHVGFERQAFSDSFLAMAADLDRRIPTLQAELIVVEFQRLLAQLGDGHSFVEPAATERVSFSTLPIDCYWFSDGLFIIDGPEDCADWIGGRMLKVGTKAVEEVLQAMAAYIPADNPMAYKRNGPSYLKIPAFLYAVGATDNFHVVRLTIQTRNGTVQEVTLTAGSFPFSPTLRPSRLSDAPVPLYLQYTGRNFWFRNLDRMDALYIQYNQVRDMAEETIEVFAARLRDTIRTTQTRNLIVDVRHNSGGNNFLNWPLLRSLVHFETDAADNRLFVLTGRRTFSACQNFINWLERMTQAIFVGEPSSSRPNFIGETTNVMLPYSGVQASISSRVHFDSFWGDERQWIAPHIPIALSSDAYFANQDPVLEAVLSLIGT